MSVVTLTINNELVSARAGQLLLEVIRENGIQLPTLCHMDGLSQRGGCRLCLVEVAGSNKLVPSCATTAQEGLVVQTHTERLIQYRRMVLELLFAERNHICSVCVANGHCELQTAAAALGMDHVRFEYVNQNLGVDTSHERYGLDQNRCIGRGINTRVITELNQPWGKSLSCTRCGKCVQVCPTGALFTKGATVAEMEKNPLFLKFILTGRNKREWIW
jgi:bidirectional [NiFe] hydrogenase diaphorase subunit